MSKPKYIFIDPTNTLNHRSIKNISIGASEHQFYNLIYNLSKTNEIICFNGVASDTIIDNIKYSNIGAIFNFPIDISDKIIIQRIFLNDPNFIKKIINNKIFIWIHDLICPHIFLGNNLTLTTFFNDNPSLFKNFILNFFIDRHNINYIFPSDFSKNLCVEFFGNYGFEVAPKNLHTIYNILYEEEFIKVKNMTSIDIDLNKIVFASSWSKNIDVVIKLFDFLYSKNDKLKLFLMSPGWENDKFKEYEKEIKDKYQDNIIILGKQNKEEYSKVIKSALCVLSSNYKETFGCVFTESYYLGTPVIADIGSGGTKEIVDPSYIVDYNKPELVLEKINELQLDRTNRPDRSNPIELDRKFLLEDNIKKWTTVLL